MFQCDVRLRFEIFGFKMGKVTMGHPEQYILNYEKNTERVLWKKSTKIILSKEDCLSHSNVLWGLQQKAELYSDVLVWAQTKLPFSHIDLHSQSLLYIVYTRKINNTSRICNRKTLNVSNNG
jgi:hypothetical protein